MKVQAPARVRLCQADSLQVGNCRDHEDPRRSGDQSSDGSNDRRKYRLPRFGNEQPERCKPVIAYRASAIPSSAVPKRAVVAVISPRPAQVPRQTASSIGHSRRSTTESAGPASICQTLVMSDGKIRMAAACTGGITTASRPMEIVGRPRPITPLMNPASANTNPTKMRTGSSTGQTVVDDNPDRNAQVSK
jgi:hypothetical protein